MRLSRLRSLDAALVAASIVVLTSGCGGGSEEPAKARAASSGPSTAAPALPASAGPATSAPGSGAVSGRVVFEGVPPANPKYRMTADSYCAKSYPGEVTKEEVVVGKDRGLVNVFVWVKSGISGSYPAPAASVVLDQKGCLYRPHVFGIQVGQPLEIANSDDTLHNVHSISDANDAFNLGMPRQGMKVTRRFDKPEVMVKIKCDVHGWMASYAGVVPHPFFAVSGPDGAFAVKDLPPGAYTLEAWHEKLGTQTLQITVGEKETKTVGFTFKSGAAG